MNESIYDEVWGVERITATAFDFNQQIGICVRLVSESGYAYSFCVTTPPESRGNSRSFNPALIAGRLARTADRLKEIVDNEGYLTAVGKQAVRRAINNEG